MQHREKSRSRRLLRVAAGIGVGIVVAAGATAGVAAASPVDPYVDKYGAEICDALSRSPSHQEVLHEVATVRDYDHLSDGDASWVIEASVSRLCPQFLGLVYQSG